MMPYNTLTSLHSLPVPKDGCTAHYEGSIDKKGGNEDWDWFLYQDENQEWVLFEHLGPGCIFNFVQHRYPCCDEPEFRFYFDGESTPRFTIRHSEFGEKYPFIEPVAARYIGPPDHGRGPIRVVRSFVPMPYQKSLKITSTIKLFGNDRTKNEGGWGHVVYHAYESAAGIETFTAQEQPHIQTLVSLWKETGSCVHPLQQPLKKYHHNCILPPGDTYLLMDEQTAGTIAGIRIITAAYEREHLNTLTLSCYWDGHEQPDIEAPFGCFFANELGYHSVSYLLSGMSTDGRYYNYYPMPFTRQCRILIRNSGLKPVSLPLIEILWTREWNNYYQEHGFYYFRNTPYYRRRHTEGADSVIADISGSGHIVSAIITGFGETPESRADCEGDVRIHFNGIRTPQIESDGSESYACYGWGYETPKENHPAGGYDGHEHKDWSMHRALPGDWYPYWSGFRFGIESGGSNDLYMEHSGMVFYYGSEQVKLHKIGEIDFARPETLAAHSYSCQESYRLTTLTAYFEGDDDHIPVTLTGHYATGPRTFTLSPPSGKAAIILRRVSDQQKGRQKALVYVNDTLICEYPWYIADSNPDKRWLEDEFIITEKYFKAYTDITIRIEPQGAGPSFNEFGYQFFIRT